MEMTVAQVAAQAGCTDRQVRQAVDAGWLSPLRTVGRQLVLDDTAVIAWRRSTARGPRWVMTTRAAALDLLAGRTPTTLAGSGLSRLRGRLRSMDARAIAHAAGGLGGSWARYRAAARGGWIGPSALQPGRWGIAPGDAWMRFVEAQDLDVWELEHDAVLDADGDVGVVERSPSGGDPVRLLLDCYLLGDARVSAAAAAELEERARAV